jgi:hypothetical protein
MRFNKKFYMSMLRGWRTAMVPAQSVSMRTITGFLASEYQTYRVYREICGGYHCGVPLRPGTITMNGLGETIREQNHLAIACGCRRHASV